MSAIDPYTLNTLLTLQTISSCVLSPFGQYVYAHFLDTYPYPDNGTTNYTIIPILDFLKVFNDANKNCSTDDDDPDEDDALAYAQQRSADLFFWMTVYSSGPMFLMTYILGLYLKKIGTRLVLLLPFFGTLIETGIQLLVIYFELPEYWWYIGNALNACTGAASVQSFVMTVLITESTEEDNLSTRFTRIGAAQTAIGAAITFAVGHYIVWRGYRDLFWCAIACNTLAVLVAIIFYRSRNSNASQANERTPLLASTTDVEIREPTTNHCSNFFEICAIFSPYRRSKKKTASIYLTLLAVITFTFASTSYTPFLWYMLDVPFCWTSKEVGNYSALSAITGAILSVLGLKALSATGASEPLICMISHLFFCASSIWISFARRGWELYASLLVSGFSGYQSTLAISMMLNWVEASEVSNALVFITLIATLVTSIGTSFFSFVYARTVVHYRNLTLVIGAGICVIPFILNLCLYLVLRKMPEVDLPPSLGEEIEPTPVPISTVGVPHAGDAACLIVTSRSLPTTIRSTPIDRSPTNSVDENATDAINNSTNINV